MQFLLIAYNGTDLEAPERRLSVRESLDASLREEPYITKKVWEKIEIKPFRLAGIN